MPSFYALIDAVSGQEDAVEARLRTQPQVKALARCKEGNYDFLIRIEADSFDTVDDILQTYVGPGKGIKATEPITDWAHYSATVSQARAKLG